MRKKIRPPTVVRNTKRIVVDPIRPDLISFSYRYYARTAKFNAKTRTGTWFESLIERLRALSSLTPQEVLSSRSPALRAHPIDFSQTTEPTGFTHLARSLQEYTPYQFQLSQATGRVHGFFIDVVFHIVWLDPHHRLYG